MLCVQAMAPGLEAADHETIKNFTCPVPIFVQGEKTGRQIFQESSNEERESPGLDDEHGCQTQH